MLKCQKSVGIVERINLDVCDIEGNLKYINRDELSRKKFTNEFLKPREAYVLVEIKLIATTSMVGAESSTTTTTRVPSGKTSPFQTYQARPLLTNTEIVTNSFLNKLTPKSLNKNSRLSHRNSITSLSNTSISSGVHNEKASNVTNVQHSVMNTTSHKSRKLHKN